MEQNTSYKSLKNKGFTLVEIVVVIAIMIVLLAVLTPSLLRHVENSRMQRDESAVDEVVHTIHLAMADPATFDEVYNYSIPNNYTTYTDSSAIYGSKYTDEEFWAPDGSGRTVTITFNPDANGDYNIAEGIVNNMTLGNGSLSDERALDATKQCTLATMGNKELYTAINKTIGPILEEASATYQNSSYTVFIEFNTLGAQRRVDVYGEWNGTNLSTSSNVSNSSGTSTVPPEEEEEVNTPAPPTQPNMPPVDLGGSGGTTSGGGEPYQPTQPTPHSHDYTILNTPATCTKEGLETKTCSCGDVQTSTIPALGHTEIQETEVAATCTQEGSTRGTRCSVCNTVIERQTPIAALGHAYEVTQTTAPTCLTTGLKTFTCSRCGTSYTETIEIIAHQDNNNDFFCDTCNKNLCEHTQVVIPPVPPTCITTGLTEGLKCDKCNTIITPQETIPALGHIDTDNNGYCDRCEPVPQKHNITLVYNDGVTPSQTVQANNKTELSIPNREGYRFDGWYSYVDAVGSKEIASFTNPNSTYPWTKDASGIWSSGNKAVKSTTSNMLSEAFTLETNGSISFQWRSNGESNYDYLGYDILNVTTGKYLSGKTSPTYSSCLATLKGKASTSYTTVTYNLSAGTYKILFMYGKDSSVDKEEDKGFVKNVIATGVRSTALGPAAPSQFTEDITVGAKWTGNSYTIVYNGNTASSGTTTSSTHVYGTESQLRANGFIKNQYVFKSWNTKADGSGTTYRDKESILNLSSTQGDIITLYAQWEKGYNPETLVFKTDKVAYLYSEDNQVLKTYTGWATGAYSQWIDVPWYKDRKNIKHVVIEDGVSPESTKYWFFDYKWNESYVIETAYIGNAVTKISESTFEYCRQLKSIEFNNSPAVIDREAITYNDELTTVKLGNQIKSIGYGALNHNPKLLSVTIPDTTTSIGDYAFEHNTALQSISIGKNVSSIGDGLTEYCVNLKSITVSAQNSNFRGKGNCIVRLKDKTLLAGCQNTIIPSDGTVEVINYASFRGITTLTNITIPNTVRFIDSYAFSNTGITSLVIPGSTFKIISAFTGCTSLETVVLSEGVESIFGDFSGCVNLKTIQLPNSLKTVGQGTFTNCSSLKTLSFGPNIKYIRRYNFDGCTSLESISIENSSGFRTDRASAGGVLVDLTDPVKNVELLMVTHASTGITKE